MSKKWVKGISLGFVGLMILQSCSSQPKIPELTDTVPDQEEVSPTKKEFLQVKSKTKIDISQSIRISVIPIQNKTGLSNQRDWVTSNRENIQLLAYFDTIQADFSAKLSQFSKYGRIQLVPQYKFPSYRIQISFEKMDRRSKYLNIPCRIRAIHQVNPEKNVEILINHGVSIENSQVAKSPYYFWGKVLADYQATFPTRKILAEIMGEEL